MDTVEDRKIKDSAIAVRGTAATTLGKIRDARAIEALIEAVQRNRYENVRAIAAEMLGEIKDPRAIKPLLGALIDTEYLVCKAAARALPKININWAKSEAARAAVPMFITAFQESERTLRAHAEAPEEAETDFIPDRLVAVRRFRHEIRVESERHSNTVSWAAKEALKLVDAWVDEPGSTPRQ